MNGRLFLSHWPVKEDDVESVSIGANGTLVDVFDYELEEASGKISNISVGGNVSIGWNHPVVVHYKGGYQLPDEAPKPLKNLVVLMIREERIRMTQAQTAGIRQLSHKEARVSFFDPNMLLLRSVGAKSPTLQAIDNILYHYTRIEV